jgi:hypothetical protein
MIISTKKTEGILHASDSNIIIAAKNIKANPMDVVMPARLLLRIRANIEEIEKRKYQYSSNQDYSNLSILC